MRHMCAGRIIFTLEFITIGTKEIAPEINLNPVVDTNTVGNTWKDASAMVTDNSGEALIIVVTGEVDSSTVGTYEITYTATDSLGNSASVTCYVDIVE